MIGVVFILQSASQLKLGPDVTGAKDHETKHRLSHLPEHRSRQESKPRRRRSKVKNIHLIVNMNN